MKRTAWLIAAGFSYELGMPLVDELTREIKDWLTPSKLEELATTWAKQGKPVPRAVIAATSERLATANDNYEKLIEWLQARHHAACESEAEHWWFLVLKLQQIVGKLLTLRHIEHQDEIRRALPWYRGLQSSIPASEPLWIFSLNHDLCIELLAAELGIPVSCGYTEPSAIAFTGNDGRRVTFDRLSRDCLSKHQLDFPTGRGINLVKLHGSLEVFAYNDRLDYLRLHPAEATAAGWLNGLTMLDKHLNAKENGNPVVVENEICVFDDARVLQFLRRTLVAGGFKFDGRGGYNAPGELIELFARKLDDFDELVIIGYSWCDRHINEPIERWLTADAARRVTFVNPTGLPEEAKHLEAQINFEPKRTGDWLESVNPSAISTFERQHRELRLLLRRFPGSRSAATEVLRSLAQGCGPELAAWVRAQPADEDNSTIVERLRQDPAFSTTTLLEKLVAGLKVKLGS